MGEKLLMKGNEAIAEAGIKAGCRHFFGYPITPQNELPAYMARQLPKLGGTFLQAESEVAAINMVYGASAAGARVMTSSSSPGISLKMEGISYLAGSELPAVIVNIIRGGPGLGGIQPAQSDYFQATKGGGHGDYHMLVLAPQSVQEAVDLTIDAFELADKYLNPVMILGDGMIGQMMEPVEFSREINPEDLPPKTWATSGCTGREPNIINSLGLQAHKLEEKNLKLLDKYNAMRRNEVRVETEGLEDAEYVLVAYGTTARIARSAMAMAREKGVKVGLIRPITLFPFPYDAVGKASEKARFMLTVEMSCGQMVEDVRLGANGRCPVYFYGRVGGMVPEPAEVLDTLMELVGGEGA